MKIEQIYKVVQHKPGENDEETQIEMDQDFLDIDFTLLRIIVPNTKAIEFPVNSNVKLTIEKVEK